MGRHTIPLCGFGHVILFDESSSFKTYMFTMKDTPRMTETIKESYYEKVRKQYKSHLNTR